MDFSEFETAAGGIWRICAVIDYATQYWLAATVTPTARGVDALACLTAAVQCAQRLLALDDLRADRGEVALVDEATGELLCTVPAPIAVVSDNGPCFRGATFAEVFAGDDPLLRHVRTRVRSLQTNRVIERFFATLN
jgi:putative transposase